MRDQSLTCVHQFISPIKRQPAGGQVPKHTAPSQTKLEAAHNKRVCCMLGSALSGGLQSHDKDSSYSNLCQTGVAVGLLAIC